MITRRTAGAALLVYGLGTIAANALIAAPGGTYKPDAVDRFVGSGHYAVVFALAYVGCLASVAVLPFVLGMRDELGRNRDLAWGLGVAAAATGVVGWFAIAGVDVAMAEGGSTVQEGVPHPVVFMVTEIGNLVAWCAPALFVGIIAILLSRVSTLPGWLRIFSVVAGVCGILAPFFLTFFLYVLWTLVTGVTLMSRTREVAHA